MVLKVKTQLYKLILQASVFCPDLNRYKKGDQYVINNRYLQGPQCNVTAG